jgi:para-aminobenzoate synthetase component 1
LNQATGTNCIFPVTNFTEVKDKVLNWANRFNTFCFLDNHQYQLEPHTQECMLAAGIHRVVDPGDQPALSFLQHSLQHNKGWLFGHLSYDLKNEIEDLSSANPDPIGFPSLFFFEPKVLIRFDQHNCYIETKDSSASRVRDEIFSTEVFVPTLAEDILMHSRFTREEYISTIKKLQQHILRGDCYEINFCQEFFTEEKNIDPLSLYKRLAKISPNPFSALYRLDDRWLICASPERFLKKQGMEILSQPIKGTSKRVPANAMEDQRSLQQLGESSKDRAENVMIVDLVRNDLSKVCEDGSVQVNELFGLYSFPQVHQMISTISGQLKKNTQLEDILRATFPMGSMTGAPKKRVMQLIEQYEKTKRGIFSGAVGYISPAGDFDFNVVIRSLLYNRQQAYLSYLVGSAITHYSDPQEEWEECRIKAEAMRRVLGEIN